MADVLGVALLPVPEALSAIVVSRQALRELAAALHVQRFLRSAGADQLSVAGAFVALCRGDPSSGAAATILRRVHSIDLSRQLVRVDGGSEVHPLAAVLPGPPTPPQWREACRELAGRLLRGEAAPLTIPQVRSIASNVSRLARAACALGLSPTDKPASTRDAASTAPPQTPRDCAARRTAAEAVLALEPMPDQVWDIWLEELRLWTWNPVSAAAIAEAGCLPAPSDASHPGPAQPRMTAVDLPARGALAQNPPSSTANGPNGASSSAAACKRGPGAVGAADARAGKRPKQLDQPSNAGRAAESTEPTLQRSPSRLQPDGGSTGPSQGYEEGGAGGPTRGEGPGLQHHGGCRGYRNSPGGPGAPGERGPQHRARPCGSPKRSPCVGASGRVRSRSRSRGRSRSPSRGCGSCDKRLAALEWRGFTGERAVETWAQDVELWLQHKRGYSASLQDLDRAGHNPPDAFLEWAGMGLEAFLGRFPKRWRLSSGNRPWLLALRTDTRLGGQDRPQPRASPPTEAWVEDVGRWLAQEEGEASVTELYRTGLVPARTARELLALLCSPRFRRHWHLPQRSRSPSYERSPGRGRSPSCDRSASPPPPRAATPEWRGAGGMDAREAWADEVAAWLEARRGGGASTDELERAGLAPPSAFLQRADRSQSVFLDGFQSRWRLEYNPGAAPRLLAVRVARSGAAEPTPCPEQRLPPARCVHEQLFGQSYERTTGFARCRPGAQTAPVPKAQAQAQPLPPEQDSGARECVPEWQGAEGPVAVALWANEVELWLEQDMGGEADLVKLIRAGLAPPPSFLTARHNMWSFLREFPDRWQLVEAGARGTRARMVSTRPPLPQQLPPPSPQPAADPAPPSQEEFVPEPSSQRQAPPSSPVVSSGQADGGDEREEGKALAGTKRSRRRRSLAGRFKSDEEEALVRRLARQLAALPDGSARLVELLGDNCPVPPAVLCGRSARQWVVQHEWLWEATTFKTGPIRLKLRPGPASELLGRKGRR